MPLVIKKDKLGCNAKVGAPDLLEYLGENSLCALASDSGCFQGYMQTVDTVYPFCISIDLYVSASISHCANDLICKGVRPAYATCSVGLGNELTKDECRELITCLQVACKERQIELLNAHTYKAKETAITMTLTGERKSLVPYIGQELDIIQTKPLGGVLSVMQESQERSHSPSSQPVIRTEHSSISDLVSKYGTACSTDISGYGLLGHLVIASLSSNLDITLNASSILFEQNLLRFLDMHGPSCSAIENMRYFSDYLSIDLSNLQGYSYGLFQGETNGPLTIFINKSATHVFTEELKARGFRPSLIGNTSPSSSPSLKVET